MALIMQREVIATIIDQGWRGLPQSVVNTRAHISCLRAWRGQRALRPGSETLTVPDSMAWIRHYMNWFSDSIFDMHAYFCARWPIGNNWCGWLLWKPGRYQSGATRSTSGFCQTRARARRRIWNVEKGELPIPTGKRAKCFLGWTRSGGWKKRYKNFGSYETLKLWSVDPNRKRQTIKNPAYMLCFCAFLTKLYVFIERHKNMSWLYNCG